MDASPILEVKKLSLTIDGEHILRDISFRVGRGEALVVIGPNGAGKTMLFRALLGLVPTTGEIIWAQGVRIGYVPQKLPLDRTIPLTVREFFLMRADRFWFPQKHFLHELSHHLGHVGLTTSILGKPIAELSGGQFQRLLIAWALVGNPDVLLFDEPTSGIDIEGEETIYQLIRRLQEEHQITLIMISHELHVVYRYADHVLCLNRRMVCYGEPEEMLDAKHLAELYGNSRYYRHGAHEHVSSYD